MIILEKDKITLSGKVTDWCTEKEKISIDSDSDGLVFSLCGINIEDVQLGDEVTLIITKISDDSGEYICTNGTHSSKFNTDSYNFIKSSNQDKNPIYNITVPSSLNIHISPIHNYKFEYKIKSNHS